MTHDNAIVWLRRDLRLRDNPAIAHAARHAARVLPIFVYSPDEEGEWAPGAASRWWLHHSLVSLDRELRKLGGRLIVRVGRPEHVVPQIARATGATLIIWNGLYEPALHARDRALEAALESTFAVATFGGNVWFPPGSIRNGSGDSYRVFTPFWRTARALLEQSPAPSARPRVHWSDDSELASVSIDALELLPRIRWDRDFYERWSPGETGALRRLKAFAKRVPDYAAARDRADLDGISRLSPHLHFGEITPRQIAAQLRAAHAPAALESFERQLGWREFGAHLLHAFPDTANASLDRRFEHMKWSRDGATLQAWQHGKTGYPIVDAGMRELWQTGWMHNRVRLITASFLTKNLRHHWLEGARWFWDTLVDADLANNTLGWQWVAGCGADAAPYYRIFNPVLQAERFDPQRQYIRRWVPELSSLPDRWIHQPWAAPANVLSAAAVTLGDTYPRPVVGLAQSRMAAQAAYRDVQQHAS